MALLQAAEPVLLSIPIDAAALSANVATTCQATSLGDWRNLLSVIWDFLSLSLFSLGGGNTLLSEYHYLSVTKYCWLSSSQFADLYALAEAAPGPSSMIVGLLGMGAAWKEGPFWGLLSGVAAEVAIGPAGAAAAGTGASSTPADVSGGGVTPAGSRAPTKR